MIDYDSFSHCHLTDIFFAIHAGAKELIPDFKWILDVCYVFVYSTAMQGFP